MTFAEMFDRLLVREGGLSDAKHDRGGITKYGITAPTLSQWRGKPVTSDDVRQLTQEEAQAIYQEMYFNAPGINELPAHVQEQVFDFAVNSGPLVAIQAMQEVLGVRVDGKIGPRTIAAAFAHDARGLTNGIVKWRVMMLGRIVRRNPTQVTFLGGWLSRALSFLT